MALPRSGLTGELGQSDVGLGIHRLASGTVFYLGEMAGAGILIAGYRAGLYLAATSMVALLAWMITGAWLLVRGAASPAPKSNEED